MSRRCNLAFEVLLPVRNSLFNSVASLSSFPNFLDTKLWTAHLFFARIKFLAFISSDASSYPGHDTTTQKKKKASLNELKHCRKRCVDDMKKQEKFHKLVNKIPQLKAFISFSRTVKTIK